METILTPTKDNPKTGSTKEVVLRNGFRPKVTKITGVKGKKNMNFSETVEHHKEKWEKNPTKYSSTNLGVFNWSMSPRELFTYFMTLDEIKLAIDKIKSWFISNSEMNRPPSTKGVLFESRMAYCYGIVAGVSDSNFFPVSVIDNSDGVDRMVTHLVLKDRGNLTAILKRGEEQILTVKKWYDLLKKIEANEYNEYKLKNVRFAKIIKDSYSKLENYNSTQRVKTKLSLKEVIGTDIWNEWFDAPDAINLRVKYETLGVHANEMQAYNNTETAWVQYNYLTGSIALSGFYHYDEVALSALSKIHAECLDKELFLGLNPEILSTVRHKKCEGFESWFILDNVACLNLSWNDFFNELVTNYKTPTKKKINKWIELFKETKMVKGKLVFSAYDVVKEQIDLLITISKFDLINKYHSTLDDVLEKDPTLKKLGNVLDNRLRFENQDNVHMLLKAVREISKEVFKSREVPNRKYVATAIFNNLIKSIKNGGLRRFTEEDSRTTKVRYDKFWKPLFKEVKNELSSGKPVWDEDSFWDSLKAKLISNGVALKDGDKLEILDKDSDKVWPNGEVNFTEKTGLHGCHLDNKKQPSEDNMFLHLPLYNKWWGSRKIGNLDTFMNVVDNEVYDYAKENDLTGVSVGKQPKYYNTQMLNQAVREVFNEINA
jgi:hypothetical protein